MIHTKLECVMNLTLELTFQWSKIISYDFKIIAVKLEHILKFLKLVFRAVYGNVGYDDNVPRRQE